ncbi:MAG TPA: pyrroline-5-carboxylate reductase [Thermoleophilaceae bacterium]
MRIGLIGAGNMASALARGFGEPVLVFDPVAGRAEALAEELGGEALASNAEVAEQADVVFLCHKPAQLDEVAAEAHDNAKAVVSILAATPVARVEEAYPDRPVYRFLPNIPVEVKQGVACYVPGRLASDGPESDVIGLFERVGEVVRLPSEPLIEPAMALMSSGPAFFALVVEALVEAGVKQGLARDDAAKLTVETMGGSAEVLRRGDLDATALRTRVTSPGGVTARGLAALERGGLRTAFDDAVAAVVEATR